MSVRPPTDVEGYCEPRHVADFFDKYDDFTESTNPTRQNVLRRIAAESNWIDNYTGHAWRERMVEDEYKSFSQGGVRKSQYYWWAGAPLKLQKRDIRTPMDPDKGDKLEIWTGQEWEDWVADESRTEGRGEDYWIEESTGMLYIYRRRLWFHRHKEMRVSYRYGKEHVPPLIEDVCARRVGAHYLEGQQYRQITPGHEDAPDAQTVAESWREKAKEDLEEFIEIRTGGHQ